MRLKAKHIGDELSLDEYNAYQYLLYHMDCWKEFIYLDMETSYNGDYATYSFQKTDLLINEKQETYKISKSLTDSNNNFVINISDITALLDKTHIEFSLTFYYLSPEEFQVDGETELREATDEPEVSVIERVGIPSPKVSETYHKSTVPCILNNEKISFSLKDSDGNHLPTLSIISRYIILHITLNETPFIDTKNGKANEPDEILLNKEEDLEKIIEYAPHDGTNTIIRLDSNITEYKPLQTLRISNGQYITIRGGTNTDATFNGELCHRTFIVEPNAKLTLEYITLKNNNSTWMGEYDKGRGGAILVEAKRELDGKQEYGVLRCNNCTFTNNIAEYGGAVFSYNAGLFLDTCDFIGNKSIKDGGSVYYWAKDINIEFKNATVVNGKQVTLYATIRDYNKQLVSDGYVDFYLQTKTGETFLQRSDISNYAKDEGNYGHTTVPLTKVVKQRVTNPNTEVRFNIILKNNLPVTETKNGVTTLKTYYDDKFQPGTLAEDETLGVAVFVRRVNGVALPVRYNTANNQYYLTNSSAQVLKHIVYLDELVGYTYIPENATVKNAKTDLSSTSNEVGFQVILKNNRPVTIVNNGTLTLKPYYDENFNTLPLATGETVSHIVFHKTVDGVRLPTVYDEENDAYYLQYSNPQVMKHIVYIPHISEGILNKGIASTTYNISPDNTSRELHFIARYVPTEEYEHEVATNKVTVLFPEVYTASFVGKLTGHADNTIIISVQVINEKNNKITKPKGVFTINKQEQDAYIEGEYYCTKYQIEKETTETKIPVSFELEQGELYSCEKISSQIIVESNIEEENKISTPIHGLFVNGIDRKQSGGKWIDAGVTDTLVQQWENAGITDLYVRCNVFTDEKLSSTLKAVVDKTKGKKFRIHLVMNCFTDLSKTKIEDKVTKVNPSVIARRQYLQEQINSIINSKIAIDGICYDYIRFNGVDDYCGGIAKKDRAKYVNEALNNLSSKIRDKKPEWIISACVMAETGTASTYGQKYDDMKKYVDYLMPMTYKSGAKFGSDNNIVDFITRYMLNLDGIKPDDIVDIIETYTLKSDGQTIESKRTKADLDGTIRAMSQLKLKGCALFREGLIPTYPMTYQSALNEKK